MRYRTVLSMYQGDPGLLGNIWKGVKSVARAAAPFLPGPIGGLVGGIVNRPTASPGGAVTVPQFAVTPTQAARGVVQTGVSPLGTVGVRFGAGKRRMNAGNAKAARRAIRRIKSVRKLLQSIERELPRRPALKGGSRGIITRSEAARALRS